MKIAKICLQNFRAFDEPFELDLEGGKNLLLHGENGSGKSSVYFAVKRFFAEHGDDIANHRNHFSTATRDSHVRIHFNAKDGKGHDQVWEAHWDSGDGHPLPVPKDPSNSTISETQRSLLVDASHRAGFLDYRMMLRTSLLSGPLSRSNRGAKIHNLIYGLESNGLNSQLFDLITLAILAGCRTTIAGGGETTIGTLMRRVWENRPRSRRKSDLAYANRHTYAFSQAFNAMLPELEAKLAEFLGYFENHQLTVKFQPISMVWDKLSLELKGAELAPIITFRGMLVTDHHQFLNEARLSALATCLFFAGVFLSDNDNANPAYPRFLFLDDALIGLELQNRLPVLSILACDAFKYYQIFLFTYDRVWYDLARGHLQEKKGWLHRELLADESTGKLIPKLRASQSDLQRARAHLAGGDLMAAAVYARAAFEWKLRNVCEKNGIKIAFKSDAEKVGAGVLWDTIILRQREREEQRTKGSHVRDFVTPTLETAVETIRSTVLNRLSHAGTPGLVRAEVEAALATIEALHNHDFP